MIGFSQRAQILRWVDEAQAAGARRHRACDQLGIRLRSLQRWRDGCGTVRTDGRTLRTFTPPNKLSDEERQHMLAVANEPEFAALPPSQFVPLLADRGQFVASESSFYRVLRVAHQLKHRQASRTPTPVRKPFALSTTAPNQLYSWDITYLKTTTFGRYLYLYLFVDLYSRKIVGWRVHECEDNEHAAELVTDIVRREGVERDRLVVHSDNGGPMKGATLLATMQRLGIVPSYSRPAVSNDNPYSEALFRTLKYRPNYPTKPFHTEAVANAWVDGFVQWYNHAHRHSAIRFVTPAQRHAGLDYDLLAQRKITYEKAKAAKPQRWSGNTRNWDPITEVLLNPDNVQNQVQNRKKGKVTV
ncbi:MAG: IS3 family transposase [Candidatus Competibacteraceae bacterium]|nr:IS3 family transposase [Candidatus Competibacteraceae bacterium]